MARWLNANILSPTLELIAGQHHSSIMVENREEILNAAIRALSA
jgi:hypothetical protein